MTDLRDDYKSLATAIKQTKELMKGAGHEVSDETALLVMIFREVLPQKVDRVGQYLATISGTLTSIKAGIDYLREDTQEISAHIQDLPTK